MMVPTSCGFGTLKEMVKRIVLGQGLAFLISFTGVSTTKLVNNNASYPVLQSVTAYAFIFAVYFPVFLFILYKYRSQPFSNFRFFNRWWKYAILAVIDLEANYVVVLAYQYTNMTSVQLLNCFTVPCVLVLSFFILRMKFAVTHVVGGVIAIGGLAFLIALDADGLSRSEGGNQEVLGDILCLISSLLYATSNVLTEWFVKPSTPTFMFSCCCGNRSCETRNATTSALPSANIQEPTCTFPDKEDAGTGENHLQVSAFIPVVENLVMMSSFALVFSTIQFFAIEWKAFQPNRSSWTGQDWLFQMVFGVTMLLVYTIMPIMFIVSSAAFANISLLTANIYAIIWNVTIFKIYPTKLFFVSYAIIVVGIILYNLTDIVRIPFCYRWNYPCGDPFKENGKKMEEDSEEQVHEAAKGQTQREAESTSTESSSGKQGDATGRVTSGGACELHRSQRE
ncbi:Eukaryotic protein of unknown function (DUF914), putative [Leishmania guyanensis]|uniref:Uncharacterized protein n=1 Tax=Leishmania guyanensis TaxID=5670 RepID=A0A1E1J0Y0_LEIGU|nr:hypothetical protein, conserved [Leishmania guyanensis]